MRTLEKTVVANLRAAAKKLTLLADRIEAASKSGKKRDTVLEAARVGIDASYDSLPMTQLYRGEVDWSRPIASAARTATKPAKAKAVAKAAAKVKVAKVAKVEAVAPPEEDLPMVAADGPLTPPGEAVPPSPATAVDLHASGLATALGCSPEAVLAALRAAGLLT